MQGAGTLSVMGCGFMSVLEQDMMIPSYLRAPNPNERRYGTVRYDEQDITWIVEAEPVVIELAKRLFPSSNVRIPGQVRFRANRRNTGELNWLMLRFPLDVAEVSQWEQARQDTIEHVFYRAELNRQPRPAEPLGMKAELTPFQKEGLAYLLHNRRCLLADDMGLGKTVQGLAMLSTAQLFPALIVVQPHMITNWVRETLRFVSVPSPPDEVVLFEDETTVRNRIHVLRGKKPYELPSASLFVIHYGLIASWKERLIEAGFQGVIFDEIQELRHTGTQKYSAASLLSESCSNVIGLSGTPIYNYGGEMWAVMNIIDYHCLCEWESFTREWCFGYGNQQIEKPALLGDYLRAEGLMMRRRKDEVLTQLPTKRRVVQAIDSDHKVFDGLIEQAVQQALELDGIKDHFERGRMTRQIVNDTRQATGISKAPFAADFVKLLLEADEKVLLFAYHHKVFDIFMEKLRDFHPGKITGLETQMEKDAAIDAFMDGETNILLVSLRAASGLNLQRANIVVFGELDWSPAIHSQAEDRAHRMGQEDSVLAYYLVCNDGSDEDMQEALGLKVSQFVGIMGEAAETEDDRLQGQAAAQGHMQRVIEKLKRRGKKGWPLESG